MKFPGKFSQVYRGTWQGTEVALKKVSKDELVAVEREAQLLW